MTSNSNLVAMSMLSVLLRDGTANVHRRAERTGIVSDLLKDRVSREGYQLYLRNLYEIYATLEQCCRCFDSAPWAGQFALPELYRAPSIASDLGQLGGDGWQTRLPVLDSAVVYRDRIEQLASDGSEAGLVAHIYVRYLGDLSGGQLLARRLVRHPELADRQLSFYRFEKISDLQAAKRRFRRALDEFGAVTPDPRQVVNEARLAFQYNIDLSCEAKERA